MAAHHVGRAPRFRTRFQSKGRDITCGQKRHTRNSGSTYLSERMPEQMLQRMQKILLAVRSDTRNSGSTYLSERMPEQMLQVGQTFGTDATSSKTLLADDTALRRIVIRTSKSAPQTTVLDHFHCDKNNFPSKVTNQTGQKRHSYLHTVCVLQPVQPFTPEFEDTPCRRHCLA